MDRKKIIKGLYRKALCEAMESCDGCPYDPAICAKADDRKLLLEAARLLKQGREDRRDRQ